MPKESHKQKEGTLRSAFEPRPGPGTDTVPDLGLPARLGASTDTMPDQPGVYVPPRPVASVSDHRTIEIAPVRLARDIDPRRAPTALRLPTVSSRKQRRPMLLVLTAMLLVAVVGFFAARLVVSSSAPPPARPQAAPAPVRVEQPGAPVAKGASSSGAGATVQKVDPAPPSLVTKPAESQSNSAPPISEPEVVPVAPAEIVRPKAPSSVPAPRTSSDTAKKKVREPWLE
jgi:hypothetical protein